MGTHVVSLFPDQTSAERGIDGLLATGIAQAAIGIALTDRREERTVASQLSAHPNTSAAAEETVKYGAVGGAIGLLAGLAALAVPGFGPILAAGPLAMALSTIGGAATGAVSAGMGAGLQALNISDGDQKIYADALRQGGVIVTVDAGDGETTGIMTVLRDNGATQIDFQRADAAAQAGRDWEQPGERFEAGETGAKPAERTRSA